MNKSQSNVDVAPGVPLEAVLCTEELDRRPSRQPDYEAENRALVSLAQSLADAPATILQTLADTILDVFGSESAGVSLVTEDETRFYWPAIAGVWKPHIGGGTPRDFGPCGDVLDCDRPLLFKHFERRYTYFLPVTPAIEECLLVPFYVEGKAVGTIWAIIHDPQARKFDNEDLRMLMSLGRFASSAFWAVASLGKLEHQRQTLREGNAALLLSSVRQHELTEQAEQASGRLAQLQKVTAALSEAVEPVQVAAVMVDQGVPALGAVSGSVLLLSEDDQTLVLLHSSAPEAVTRPYLRFALSLSVPATDAIRSGQPTWIESRQQFVERYPHLAEQISAWGHQAAAALPIVDKGRRIGVLALSFDRVQAFSPEDQDYALTLARLCAQALERARLYAATQQLNADLERRVRIRTNELLQSETRFRLLVNSVQDYGIFMLDPQGNIVSWNSGAQHMKGYAPEEIIGQHFSRFYTSEDNAQGRPMHGLSIAAQTGRYEVEGWRVRRDGSRFWADVVISAVRNDAGELIGFAKVTRDLTERKQIDEEVRQSREQLRQLSAHLERAREGERRHLSREMHDELGGSLTGLKMDVARLRRLWPDKADDLAALAAGIDQTIQKVRGIATQLRPAMLDDFGLVATLEWLVHDFGGRMGIDCKFVSALETLDLGSDANIGIYRAVQESLTNIARHAQATAVIVTLTEEPEDAILSVADNGRGFMMAEAMQKHSLGLVGMRERVRALSGQLEIASSPGQGTTITVKIPKPADLEAEPPINLKPNSI